MKAILLYDSADPDGRAVWQALSATRLAEWISVDASAAAPEPCVGCFGCWVRTPGTCVLPRDAGVDYYEAMRRSDCVVTLTRITWGGYATAIKAYTDRMLPLLLPDFRIVNGEMHHKLRYGTMPTFLSVGFGARSAAEESTFRRYVEAQRDQSGLPRGSGCLVLGPGPDGSIPAVEAIRWFETEAAV